MYSYFMTFSISQQVTGGIASATTNVDDFIGNEYWITESAVDMWGVVSPDIDKVVSTGRCGQYRSKAPKR